MTPIQDLQYGDYFLFPFSDGKVEEFMFVSAKMSNTGVGFQVKMVRDPRNSRFSKVVETPYTRDDLEVEVTQ